MEEYQRMIVYLIFLITYIANLFMKDIETNIVMFSVLLYLIFIISYDNGGSKWNALNVMEDQ